MQNVDVSDFLALSPAKAKSAALALFDAAMIDPAADWRGVSFALHAVVSRKRSKAEGNIADTDTADAGEFVAWADYAPGGKAANVARGRVTVTFADGYAKTVGMLAGKTAKGRKTWSIAHAVRFAVVCYKLDACRRITGSDSALYYHRGGNAAGISITLDGLIAAPEIISVISAESSETVAGDLVWSPCEANAATLDMRAGTVAAPGLIGPHPRHFADALAAARREAVVLIEEAPRIATMRDHVRAGADRVIALLYPMKWLGHATGVRIAEAEIAFAGLIDAEEPASAAPELPPADLETRLAASEIVKARTPVEALTLDDFDPTYSGLVYADRFRLVENALLAWPALVLVEDAAPAADPAPVEPMVAPSPARKPRYRYSPLSGQWEQITGADAPALAA